MGHTLNRHTHTADNCWMLHPEKRPPSPYLGKQNSEGTPRLIGNYDYTSTSPRPRNKVYGRHSLQDGPVISGSKGSCQGNS